mmetsp:Transcript_45095/g.106342  ORF Transcript_45095/g.106342 Transcript_45095/m.106342 type:complete len:233 (+) Transcript_45095:207-905(+)
MSAVPLRRDNRVSRHAARHPLDSVPRSHVRVSDSSRLVDLPAPLHCAARRQRGEQRVCGGDLVGAATRVPTDRHRVGIAHRRTHSHNGQHTTNNNPPPASRRSEHAGLAGRWGVEPVHHVAHLVPVSGEPPTLSRFLPARRHTQGAVDNGGRRITETRVGGGDGHRDVGERGRWSHTLRRILQHLEDDTAQDTSQDEPQENVTWSRPSKRPRVQDVSAWLRKGDDIRARVLG